MTKVSTFSILLVIFYIIGCNNNVSIANEDKENIQKARQDSIISCLKKSSNKQFKLFPRDSVFRLSKEIELVMFQNSFLTRDNKIYDGEVTINFCYSNTQSDIISDLLAFPNFKPQKLKGILKFELIDNLGNSLLINPDYSTLLRFHPEAHLLNSSFFVYDSITNKYSAVQYLYTKYHTNQESPLVQNAYKIDPNMVDSSLFKSHKKGIVNKSEIIGYELTLKSSGYYYINWDDKNENLQPVSIIINVKTDSDTKNNLSKLKLFVYTQNKIDNYYLLSKRIGASIFEIIHSPMEKNLRLPLNNKYTIFAYILDEDESYLYIKKNIIFKTQNEIEIKLKRIQFDKILKDIKDL